MFNRDHFLKLLVDFEKVSFDHWNHRAVDVAYDAVVDYLIDERVPVERIYFQPLMETLNLVAAQHREQVREHGHHGFDTVFEYHEHSVSRQIAHKEIKQYVDHCLNKVLT